ncbi:hypothetical protein NUACC21_31790 [Scytonema sp. NUACC21]
MTKRTSYYSDLSADYSIPERVSNELAVKLLRDGETYISRREYILPEITPDYNLSQIEQENKEWWPTHCEAVRQGRADILTGEYTNNLVYFCADGPFYEKATAMNREIHWLAILSQPDVTTVWPIVMFNDEFVYCELNCADNDTKEIIVRGNATFVRRGHRGGCYFKSEQLSFFRDVYASENLLHWLRR